jgi:hypothetical protein
VPPSTDSGAIRAALDPPAADLTTPVTSATRAPSGDGTPDGTRDGTGPALGDTNAHHAERTGEVRVPQLPDGPATLDHPAIEPVQRLDTVHAAELPALNTLLVEVVAFIAAVLTTFGLTSRPS